MNQQDPPGQPANNKKLNDAHQLGAMAMSDPTAMHNPLAVMEPGEQLICEIKRHPIGMFGAYGAVSFLIILLGIVIFVVAPSLLTNYSSGQVLSVGTLIFVLACSIGAGFLLIVNIIYWGNKWIVTSDSITQVTQTGLFTKHSSQLSFEHLEDVTAEQNGLLADVLRYGVIKAETAGEGSHFVFTYCPNPTYYARQILTAREHFEQHIKSDSSSS